LFSVEIKDVFKKTLQQLVGTITKVLHRESFSENSLNILILAQYFPTERKVFIAWSLLHPPTLRKSSPLQPEGLLP